MLGRNQYDQRWIDGNVEAGVDGCGWQRPKARPATNDARPTRAAPSVKKRTTVRQRIKARVRKILHRPEPKPVTLLTPAPPPVAKEWRDLTSTLAPVPAVKVAPPPPPRSDLDDLLAPVPSTAESLGLRGTK